MAVTGYAGRSTDNSCERTELSEETCLARPDSANCRVESSRGEWYSRMALMGKVEGNQPRRKQGRARFVWNSGTDGTAIKLRDGRLASVLHMLGGRELRRRRRSDPRPNSGPGQLPP